MGTKIDHTGMVFGRLTVLRQAAGRSSQGNVMWECRCTCGTICDRNGRLLRAGQSRSCGCWFLEVAAEKGRTLPRIHGMSDTPTHNVWLGMKQRCENPQASKYDRYGGRGIKVCDRWQTFANFLGDMGERPPGMTLDRYPDQNGNYEPANCRWATQREQQNNRTNNVWLTLPDGRRMTASEAAREFGLEPDVVHQRLLRTTDPARLFKPLRKTKRTRSASAV